MPNHIVVQNLRKADLTKKRVEKIEKAIESAVREIPEVRIDSEDLSFTFLHDPTVKSEERPIMIEAKLLCSKSLKDAVWLKNSAAMNIAQDFCKTVGKWRKLSKVKVKVDVCLRSQNEGYYVV